MNPYFAEFVGTVIFLTIILAAIYFITSGIYKVLLLSFVIGMGLFIGILICVLLGGPGYLNPAVAIMLGIKDNKGFNYTSLMILMELLAVIAVLSIYYLISY